MYAASRNGFVVASELIVPLALAEQMIGHARSELPNEACGLLAGSLIEGLATAFHATRNSEASPLRYNVHPDDLVRVIFGIEDGGEDLVGIFHSHTRSPAVPSATDRRTAQYPDAFYVLATLADPGAAVSDTLRAWRIRDGESTEVALRIG
ncbi:MAG: M67 family metallopeptidase [Chloroflexota bacterium]|nr:M67 family metallopeptidase [Chloroflexota bacterium]